MLYDPKWGETVSPVKPQEPWRQLLLDAADIIERKGHCKKSLEDLEGRVCLVRALGLAIENQENGHVNYCDARSAVYRIIGQYDIVGWNNAPERTAEEVIGALRTAAVS